MGKRKALNFLPVPRVSAYLVVGGLELSSSFCIISFLKESLV